jgi:hypothetical protein
MSGFVLLYKENMKIITEKITLDELKEMSKKMYDNFVKAVVDTDKAIMAVDADMHSDEEMLFLENGSEQENLWGINIYPYAVPENFIEFDSMINIRPSFGNRSRGVDNVEIQKKIKTIVNGLIVQ